MSAIDAYERYEVNEITGCWIWTGYINADGYARLESQNAHRLFFVHHGGAIHEGWDVDHLCKRRSCVNPAHLEAVPEIVNIERAMTRTVNSGGERVRVCKEGHLIRGANFNPPSSGRSRCWLCAHPEPTSRPPYKRRLAAIADAS